MTKEELKQEAEQDADNASGLDLSTTLMVAKDKTDAYRLGRFDGYISSAEPREKRIADLEKENAEAKEIIREYYNLKNFPCASGNSINMLMYENINHKAVAFLKE